jgi:hypothetical protein
MQLRWKECLMDDSEVERKVAAAEPDLATVTEVS